MKSKILSWILTPFVVITFCAVLVVFHPLQMLALRFGYLAHKKVVDYMAFCLLLALKFSGAKVSFKKQAEIPKDRPIIFVSNHQSLLDIPALAWFFRKNHPKFISKIELGKNIPSVSYNLRHGGSVLIDRSDARQALPQIKKLGAYIEENCFSASIFPEGTRGRDGKLKKFKPGGFLALLKAAPSALVVPVVIQGSWRLLQNKLLPIPCGVHVRVQALEAIDPKDYDGKELLGLVEEKIRGVLDQKTSNLERVSDSKIGALNNKTTEPTELTERG